MIIENMTIQEFFELNRIRRKEIIKYKSESFYILHKNRIKRKRNVFKKTLKKYVDLFGYYQIIIDEESILKMFNNNKK